MNTIKAISGDLIIEYQGQGIARNQFLKLKRGQYPIERVLDLHGLKIEEAKLSLREHLDESINDGARMMLIIHGKGPIGGGSVLKGLVKTQLQSNSHVLAFTSATPKHGGTGAIYCLLKKT